MLRYCVALFLVLPLKSRAAEVYGLFMVVKGQVKVSSKGKTGLAKVGGKVFPGDTVETGADSRAKIVMSDKNVLNLSPDTKMVIEKYVNDPAQNKKAVEIAIQQGKVRASVEQKYDGEKNQFNIKTPAAVAGVRGTDFLTSYSPTTKKTEVVTFSGTVALGNLGSGGKIIGAVYVQPGQTASASNGATPEAPKAVPQEQLKQMSKESTAESPSANSGSAAPAKQSSDKGSEKKGEARTDADKKSEPEKRAETKSEGDKKAPEKRAPSSMAASGPSMIDSKDLGPDVGKDAFGGQPLSPDVGPMMPPPPPLAPIINNNFLNDATRNMRTKTTVIIVPQ